MPIDRLRQRVAALAALICVLLIASTAPVVARQRNVSMVDDRFKPVGITISVGDSVRWVNNGEAAHTVTSRVNGLFDSSLVQSGDSYTHRFPKAGTFRYYCFLHAGMNGSVVVKAAPKPQPKPTARGGGGGTGNGGQPPPDTTALALDGGSSGTAEPWLLVILGLGALGGLVAGHRRLSAVRARRR